MRNGALDFSGGSCGEVVGEISAGKKKSPYPPPLTRSVRAESTPRQNRAAPELARLISGNST